jgi:threonine dehydrogenase-like Zn-dependent dehydrogenase
VLAAHESQLHDVPDDLSDEAAALIEPMACAVHAALSTPTDGGVVAVLGAGTLGLGVTAAVAAHGSPDRLVVAARHPEQKRFARSLGATDVVGDGELLRAVRRVTGSFSYPDGTLTGGAHVVFDCVGSSSSITDAIAMCRPGGTIVLVGMAATVSVDMTPLWQKQVRLQGAYAYGIEPALAGRRTFSVATDLVASRDLGRLLSATYPLDRFTDAIDHAAHAGRRGAVKVAFDLRKAQA